MSRDVSVRRATGTDAALVAQLLTELNRIVGAVGLPDEIAREPRFADLSTEQAQRRIAAAERVETVLLAEVEGQVAGFTSLRVIPYLDQDTPYAEVTQLYVRPDFRREGVGTRLVREAEGLAQREGASCVHILAGKDNLQAQAFYRSTGYEVECLDFEKFLERRPAGG